MDDLREGIPAIDPDKPKVDGIKFTEADFDCSFCSNETNRFIIADSSFVCDNCFKEKFYNKYRRKRSAVLSLKKKEVGWLYDLLHNLSYDRHYEENEELENIFTSVYEKVKKLKIKSERS